MEERGEEGESGKGERRGATEANGAAPSLLLSSLFPLFLFLSLSPPPCNPCFSFLVSPLIIAVVVAAARGVRMRYERTERRERGREERDRSGERPANDKKAVKPQVGRFDSNVAHRKSPKAAAAGVAQNRGRCSCPCAIVIDSNSSCNCSASHKMFQFRNRLYDAPSA